MDALLQKPSDESRPARGTAGAFTDSLRLLGTRRFGTFCFASLLSNLGTWAQQIAEPWLLLSLGASSFLIGLDSFASGAPVWALTLFGGVLADRSDRRRVITICQSIQMLCPLTLVVLLLAGTVQPWIVIGLSAVVGVTDALSMPSFQTIVPSIVERQQIGSALAINATQFNLSRILGPALGGILMSSIGAIACFALNAASYLPFIWVALWILPRRTLPGSGTDPLQGDLFGGIRNIVRAPQLRGALLTVVVTSTLCGPLVVFCPVLVKNIMHRGVGDFGLAVGAFGIGGLLGAIALLGVSPRRNRRRISSRFAAANGLILVFTALNPWFWGVPLLLGLAGVATAVSNTSANTLVQATTSPALRGEAVSLYMLAMRGGVAVGGLLTGMSVSALGVQEALLLNGIVALAAQLALGQRWLAAPAE